MEIRKGTLKDLEAIAAVEAACFPAAEAATAEEFAERLQQYGDHFWLLWEGERLLAFVDGFCTDWPDLTDEMYADASLHRENGAWQMIFGVNTIPACRRQGYAGQLLQQLNGFVDSRNVVCIAMADKKRPLPAVPAKIALHRRSLSSRSLWDWKAVRCSLPVPTAGNLSPMHIPKQQRYTPRYPNHAAKSIRHKLLSKSVLAHDSPAKKAFRRSSAH